MTVCNFPSTSEAPLSTRKDPVSTEANQPEAQELELWDRIRTTEGAERAEVLGELSHFAFKKNNYTECIQLIDTSIEIYFSLESEFHTKELIHLYEGKAYCHSNLDQFAEAAQAHEMAAGYFCHSKWHLQVQSGESVLDPPDALTAPSNYKIFHIKADGVDAHQQDGNFSWVAA